MTEDRRRSKSYPILSTREASVLLRERLLDPDAPGHFRRSQLVKALGYTKESGIFNRKLSALLQYGLLEADEEQQDEDSGSRNGGSTELFCIAPDALKLQGKPENRWIQFFRGVMKRPPVFRNLLHEVEEQGEFPDPFEDFLFGIKEKLGLTESACSDVAEVFLDSARHVGLIASGNQLIDDYSTSFPLQELGGAGAEVSTRTFQVEVPLRNGVSAEVNVKLPEISLTESAFEDTRRKVLLQVEFLLDYLEPTKQGKVVRFESGH